jgi:hypothetical protein
VRPRITGTDGNPVHVTLGQAAKQSGLSKSTISRAILQGKLFAVRSADTGSYQIEQSELARYLDAVAVIRAEAGAPGQAASSHATAATAVLQAQIEGLRQITDLLRAELADAKKDRDRWRVVAEATGRLLSDATVRRPWWKRLAG